MIISIIVPIYNSEFFLNKCLESLVNQAMDHIEIILINDGSTDKSEDICLEFMKKYENIKYFKMKNSGCSFARNYGLKKSTGKYIMFVDSDDYVEKNYCKSMYKEIVEGDLDLVCCDFKVVDLNGKKIKNKENKKYGNLNIKEILLDDDMSGFVVNKIFKSKKIKKYGIKFLENSHVFEDKAFMVSYILKSTKFKTIKLSLYNYVANYNSVMLSFNLNKIKDIYISLNHIKNEFLKDDKVSKADKIKIYKELYKNRGIKQVFKILEMNYLKKYNNFEKIKDLEKDIFQNLSKEKLMNIYSIYFYYKLRLYLFEFFPKVISLILKTKNYMQR